MGTTLLLKWLVPTCGVLALVLMLYNTVRDIIRAVGSRDHGHLIREVD